MTARCEIPGLRSGNAKGWRWVQFGGAVLVSFGLATGPAMAGGALPASPPSAAGALSVAASTGFGKVPLHFEPNVGQMDEAVRFVARGGGYIAYLTDDGFTLSLRSGNCDRGREPHPERAEEESARPGPNRSDLPCRTEAVKVRLQGRSSGGRFVAESPLEGRSSYFLGKDPSKWRSDVPHYGSIRYEGVYPGVDLVFRPSEKNLRYDFEVRPDGDPASIRLQVEGVQSSNLEEGVLVHRTPAGGRLEHRDLRATAGSENVAATFQVDPSGDIRFRVGRWSRSERLVIDPTLVWGTYLGGGGPDVGYAITLDAAGNSYVAGFTESPDFPATPGAVDNYESGDAAFAAKLNAGGTVLLYSAVFGGSDSDYARAISVDGNGNAYVAGDTGSFDFPTTSGAFDRTFNGLMDVFVLKLNATGSGLVFSTFLGGAGYDYGFGMKVDGSGNPYVTGRTDSSGFPATAGAYDPTPNGNYDAFVTKLSSSGASLVYSTFLGGYDYDNGFAVTVDANGNAFVAGSTWSEDYPTSDTFGWGFEVFVTALDATGSSLSYSRLLGGDGMSYGYGIAVDASGSTYVTGYTDGYGYFPTTAGAFDTTHNGGNDTFVTKLSAGSGDVVYSTFLGGALADVGRGVAVDASGSAYVTGYSSSPDFPTTGGAYDPTHNGGTDVFVAKIDPTGGSLAFSTFLGGSSADMGHAIALDGGGNAHVTGTTAGAGFPTTAGAYDPTHNGGGDVFVTALGWSGTSLLHSTYLGGSGGGVTSGWDQVNAIAVSSAGGAYVTGQTPASDFPATGGSYDSTQAGSYDVFVAELNSAGSGLVYSTFLGGGGLEYGLGIALDGNGNAHVTGYTSSSDFPATTGAYDTTWNGSYDAFVTKLSPTGTSLAYSTFLGTTANDYGRAMAIDGYGRAIVTGSTSSSSFPTTPGSFDTTRGGNSDAFVTALDAGGSSLVYSTFLGGASSDSGYGIAAGANGLVFVTGTTSSSDFPTTPAVVQTTRLGGTDGFVTALSISSPTLAYSTFLGGTGSDYPTAIAVGPGGRAYVTGYTDSADFLVAGYAFDETYNGGTDVFVSNLDASGTGFTYSTFIGGSGNDYGFGIALDPAGNAFVTGSTYGPSFPTTPGAFAPVFQGGWRDAIVAELNPTGSGLLYSTFLGGINDEVGLGIAVHPGGAFFVGGWTGGSGFPTGPGSFDRLFNGSADGFVVKFEPYDTLGCGSSIPASLDTSDSTAGHRGSLFYTDTYRLEATAGQRVTIDMTSGSIDTYLLLVGPGGSIAAQDNNSGGGTNARISSYVIPTTGTWIVEATSFSQSVTGGYTLSLQCDCLALTITPASATPSASAGSTPVTITASPLGCNGGSWTAQSNDPWLAATPTSGSGSGSVTVSWTANGGATARTGTIALAGRTFTVTQAGPPCDAFAISPTSFSPGGGPGSTQLAVAGFPQGCSGGTWSAISYASWLSVSPGSGTGPGSVTVSWGANTTGVPRSGSASVAGSTFVLSQGVGLRFHTLTPCRVHDTRELTGFTSGAPLQAGSTTTFAVTGRCNLPATAKAVSANVTVTAPASAGYLKIFPVGSLLPVATAIHFQAGQTRANNANLALGTNGELNVFCGQPSGGVHFIFDVSGWFE